jgi:hypothetical protein
LNHENAGFTGCSGQDRLCAPQGLCDEPEWKLHVGLADGSLIVGTPENKPLKLDVGFGAFDIPLQRIRQARWKKDGPAIRVELTNRDIIKSRAR